MTVRLRALGSDVSVECRTPEDAERLRQDWSWCLAEVDDPADVTVDLQPAVDAEAAHYALASALTYRLVDQQYGRRLMLHACGLSDDSGAVLALVAASGTGKTTAARVLAAAEFGYVTDETVAVAADGTVERYEKPLSILDPGSGRKRQHGPEALGLRRAPAALHLARVVLLDRDESTLRPTLEPLTLLDAMMTLIPQTSSLTGLTSPLHVLARTLDGCGGAYRLSYSEIAECADLLADLVAVTPDTTSSWEELAAPSGSPDATLWDGRWRLAAVQDAIRVGDEGLLLVDGVPMRLAGIGMTIWTAVGTGLAHEGILDEVVAQHGAHPEAERLVDEALRHLVAAGAVTYHRPLTLAQVLAGDSADVDVLSPGASDQPR